MSSPKLCGKDAATVFVAGTGCDIERILGLFDAIVGGFFGIAIPCGTVDDSFVPNGSEGSVFVRCFVILLVFNYCVSGCGVFF